MYLLKNMHANKLLQSTVLQFDIVFEFHLQTQKAKILSVKGPGYFLLFKNGVDHFNAKIKCKISSLLL